MSKEYVSFSGVTCIAETEKALRCETEDGEGVWVPKSLISPESDVQSKGDEGELEVEKWWALKEGLIDG